MADFVSFGEVLLRLKSPGNERFLQSPALEATFGGAEANVAVSLANFGLNSGHVTALPDNEIADAAIGELRRFGVDTSLINRQGQRVGTYYLEAGAAQRPGRVIYDRAHSSLCDAVVGDFDWDKVFDGAKWFHTSGITPAISQSAVELTLEAMKVAREKNITVSFDLNFRGNLWKYCKNAQDVLPELMKYTDVAIAGREDCQKCLGVDVDVPPEEDISKLEHFELLSQEMMSVYPDLKSIALTLRQSISADEHRWSACIRGKSGFHSTDIYEIKNIIDRVGAGDSFAAGLIYGLSTFNDEQKALDFATAAGCLKHSIAGDVNRVTVEEVLSLMNGASSGRVQR